jgi:phosphoglycolate phosphatase-like HAD superfamily hydrolase
MKRSSLKLAVFDLDGTLVHLEHEHFVDRIQHTLSTIGLVVPSRERIQQVVQSHVLDDLFPESERAECKRLFWSAYEEGELPDPRPFEHAVYALEESVMRGLTVAIATARKTSVDELVQRLAPTDLMKHVQLISTWHGTDWTDKREQLGRVCEQLRIAPSESMMVGDAPHDISSAAHNGFALRIAVSSHATPKEAVIAASPDVYIHCISHVPRIVDEYVAQKELHGAL